MPPTNHDFSVNNVWGQNTAIGELEELTTPSGQTCRARRIGMEGLIEAGILAHADSLTALVDSKHVRKVKGAKGKADGEELNMKTIMKDPSALKPMIELCDAAVPHIVDSPRVLSAYQDVDGERVRIPVEDRREGVVYTDMIGMEDKFWLFQWAVGDMGDVAPFRGPAADDVAGVADGADVPVPTIKSSGNRAQRRGSSNASGGRQTGKVHGR